MTSTLPALVQAASGSLGSACANTIAYPLDVVTTRLQARKPSSRRVERKYGNGINDAIEILRRTIRKHGLAGLYAGLGSDTASTLMSNFLYFYAYSFMRYSLQRRVAREHIRQDPKKVASTSLTVVQELGLGFLAGVLSRMITTPLSVITVRLQVENEKDTEDDEDEDGEKGGDLVDTVREIYEEDGVSGFWKGFQSTLVLSTNPAITLVLFQLYRRLVLRGKNSAHPTPAQAFAGAAVSSSIAVTLLYPLILIKTRLQSSRRSKGDALHGKQTGRGKGSPLGFAAQIVKQEGFLGLYQGLEVQLLKGIISQGITFSLKQRIENVFVHAYRAAAGVA